MFLRGTDGHVYSALLLNEAYMARGQALAKAAEGMKRKTAASQRRLTNQINEVLGQGKLAGYLYAEAVACRSVCGDWRGARRWCWVWVLLQWGEEAYGLDAEAAGHLESKGGRCQATNLCRQQMQA